MVLNIYVLHHHLAYNGARVKDLQQHKELTFPLYITMLIMVAIFHKSTFTIKLTHSARHPYNTL